MAIQTLTKENFTKEVRQASGPVLVDFWAPWCGYCRRLSPALDALAQEFEGKLDLGKVDVDEQPELEERFQVDTIPTLLLFRDGQAGEPLIAPGSKAQIVDWAGL